MRNYLGRNKLIYRGTVWFLFIASAFVLIRIAPQLTRPINIPSDDFVQFWAGGKLNLQQQNPYDPQSIEQLKDEVAGGIANQNVVSIMLNPPWSIPFAMPFGVLDYATSRVLWLIVSTTLVLISGIMLWRVYSGKPKQGWLGLLVAFIFAPTISMLEKGQVTGILLLGISGFLYFTVTKRNDWLAGIFVALVTIKPQLVILFWLALLFWIIRQHRWRLIISTALTVGLLTLISMLYNPPIIGQYIQMLENYQISNWAVPTIGAYLRYFWLGLDKFWLQFLPVALGAIWLIYYWHHHRETWNWADELPIILLVSVVVSPYYWTYDLVVLIPAIILATVWISKDWKRPSTLVFSAIFIAISLGDMILHMRLDEFWFIWMAPAILVFFLVVRKKCADLPQRASTSGAN